ncbi:IS66 family insertion sequence element accessory protein TnpB [Parabacteroides sp.]
MSSCPTDMRKGCEGLAELVRESMGHDPHSYNDVFIFYSKDCHIVKILHYDLNGYVLYVKWFDDGCFLKPVFFSIKRSHDISRETLILLLSTAVQTKLII